MKKILLLTIFTAMLSACAGQNGDTGPAGLTGPQGDTGPVTTPNPVDPVQADINKLVQDENDYRLGLGQTMLSNGLSCTLYTVTGGDRIQASITSHNTLTGVSQVATFLLKSVMNQPDSPVSDGMNVLPAALQNIYQNMYLLRCTGQIVVTQTGMYQFDMVSDDAGLVYLDGAKLVDNDNNHGATLASGSKYLRRGVHAYRVDYAQTGAGSQALIVKANGSLVDPMYLFH